MTLDRAVNQKCTCVNKRQKKRKQVDVMKEYRQVPAAVERVDDKKARVRTSLQGEGCGPPRPPFEQPQPRFRSAAMVKRRIWVNIAVFPCLHSSLTHNRTINPFEDKVWEIHIFINSVFVRSLKFAIIFDYGFALYIYVGYTTILCNNL